MDKIRLLIVDDSTLSQRMISECVDKERVEICGSAKTGTEGLELYRSLQPDVVTMDLTLPDMDGLACSREIFMANSKAKIIMLSAIKDEILVARGSAIGIRSFLQKPVKKEPLMTEILRVCTDNEDNADWQEKYLDFFIDAFRINFQEMAGLGCEIEVLTKEGTRYNSHGIAVIIGITGNRHGRVIMDCAEETARRFMEIVLKTQDVAENEILNGMAEFTNIISGHGVSRINNGFKGAEFRLTPPSILFGDALSIYNPNLNSVLLKAATEIGSFEISVGFAGGDQ